MEKVKFTQMKDGSKEDYLLLEKHEKKFIERTASRILKYMSSLTSTLEGYQVSRQNIRFKQQQELYKIKLRMK